MPELIADHFQRGATLSKPGRQGVPHVVPSQARQPDLPLRPLEMLPSIRRVEHVAPLPGKAGQQVRSLVVDEHAAPVAALDRDRSLSLFSCHQEPRQPIRTSLGLEGFCSVSRFRKPEPSAL